MYKADLFQVFRCNGQRNGVADRLVKPVVRTILIEIRLRRIGKAVIVVSEFVMDGREIHRIDLDTHLDTDVLFCVEVPRACVANNIAVRRL